MKERDELFNELRQWMSSHDANELIDAYAHGLAEKQRRWEGPAITMLGRTMVPLEVLADSIDPEKED